MAELILFGWVLALLYACNRGWRRVKKAHEEGVERRKAKRAQKKADKPDIPGPVLFTMQAAEWIALLKHGWRPLGEGLVEGAKLGWAKGQERAAKLGPPAPPESDQASDKPAGNEEQAAGPGGEETGGQPSRDRGNCQVCGARLHLEGDRGEPLQIAHPDGKPCPGPPGGKTNGTKPKLDVLPGGAGTSEGDAPMAEINNVQDLHRETNEARDQATANVDDVTAAIKRAEEALKRAQGISAAGKRPEMKMPPGDQRVLDAMVDPFKAAEQRLKEARSALANAQSAASAALVVTAKHVGLVGQAAGSAYKAG